MPSFESNVLTQWHEIRSQESRDSRLSYGKNLVSLSHLGLKFAHRKVETLGYHTVKTWYLYLTLA